MLPQLLNPRWKTRNKLHKLHDILMIGTYAVGFPTGEFCCARSRCAYSLVTPTGARCVDAVARSGPVDRTKNHTYCSRKDELGATTLAGQSRYVRA